MKNATRIRTQLWNEVKELRSNHSSHSHKVDKSSNHHSSRKLSEDVRVCQAVASCLFMKAAKLCAGNDVIYRSLPFTVTGQKSRSCTHRSESSETTDWSQITTFMTTEVMLLHPQTGSAVSLSTHRAPEYVGK